MKILGLDLATICGWCSIDDKTGECAVGVLDCTPKRNMSPGFRYSRFLSFLGNLGYLPSEVYFEDVARHKGVRAAHVFGGFKAVMEMWCHEHRIPCHGLAVGSIKKFATGNGQATKEMMVDAAVRRSGLPITDHNAADAFWVATMGAGDLSFLD